MNTLNTPGPLNQSERELLHEQLQGRTPRLLLRTATRVDTGLWWMRTRLWLCVLEDELMLFAAARRRYCQRVPLVQCAGIRYCHTAGALALGVGDRLRFAYLSVTPIQALQVIDLIEQATDQPQITPSTTTENERA